MFEQKVQVIVKPADIFPAGRPPVHKIQSAVRIILSRQGAVHSLHCGVCDPAPVDGAVANRRKLMSLVDHAVDRIREGIAFHPV